MKKSIRKIFIFSSLYLILADNELSAGTATDWKVYCWGYISVSFRGHRIQMYWKEIGTKLGKEKEYLNPFNLI